MPAPAPRGLGVGGNMYAGISAAIQSAKALGDLLKAARSLSELDNELVAAGFTGTCEAHGRNGSRA
jgi:hypothetical protein